MVALISERDQITGCVLAGGQARRMGGVNKALYEHQGQPLYQYAVSNLRSCCNKVVINTHRDQAIFEQAGFVVIDDGEYAGLGPIAGIHAALAYAATPFIAFAACDQLSVPQHVYPELYRQATADYGAYVCSRGDHIPTCAVLPVSLAKATRSALIRATTNSGSAKSPASDLTNPRLSNLKSSGLDSSDSNSSGLKPVNRKSLALIPFMQAFAKPVEFNEVDFHNVNSPGPQPSS